MKAFTFAASLALSSLIPSVLGHGIVNKVVNKTKNKSYTGVLESGGGSATNSGVVRRVNTASPNHLYDNASQSIPCGPGANKRHSTGFVTADAGDQLQFIWDGGDGKSPWPHNQGPIMNYISKCSTADCNDDASTMSFYLLDRKGLKPNQSKKQDGGQWYQGDITGKAHYHAPLSFTVPSQLAPGDYLIRHEIIALHIAEQTPVFKKGGDGWTGGPEFYPSCIHVRVASKSTAKLAGQAVKFPDAYKTSSAGNTQLKKSIFVDWTKTPYHFPGPDTATFSTSQGGVSVKQDSGTGSDDTSTDSGAGSGSGSTDNADDGGDDCTDDGSDDAGTDTVKTVTVTKTITVKATATGKNDKRSRHPLNRSVH